MMMRPQQSRRWSVWMALSVVGMGGVSAFVPSGVMVTRSQSVFQTDAFLPPPPPAHHQQKLPSHRQSTQLHFMGSDGGILGVGTPELFTILLVGYFVLGPSDLYKLTKEIGKFVQNFRTFTTEATTLVENNLESQLQLEEIRKAQRELTDAFSFRRSINVDAESDAFAINAQTPRSSSSSSSSLEPDLATGPVASSSTGTTTTTTGATTTSTSTTEETAPAAIQKKIRRRRVKKKKVVEDDKDDEGVVEDDPFVGFRKNQQGQPPLANNVPDLAEDDAPNEMGVRAEKSLQDANEELRRESILEEQAAERRKQRLERLESSYGQPAGVGDDYNNQADKDNEEDQSARFQQQLGGTWNERVLANEDDLTPLAEVMERLAILEDEKMSADQRLQEEFRLREENEERYYREKRLLLEEAATKIQAQAYGTTVGPSSPASTNNNV